MILFCVNFCMSMIFHLKKGNNVANFMTEFIQK